MIEFLINIYKKVEIIWIRIQKDNKEQNQAKRKN